MDYRTETKSRVLWTLFKTCFFISACTFGGGMVIISMLQKKFVEELKWISREEVMDMVAIAQSCPGVMAVNTSIIIGYHVAGIPGALITVLGTVTPPMLILTVISAIYVQFRSNLIVSLVLRGMQAGVVAVMINVTIGMIRTILGESKWMSLLMLAGSVLAILVLNVDIIFVLLVCGIIGAVSTIAQPEREV